MYELLKNRINKGAVHLLCNAFRGSSREGGLRFCDYSIRGNFSLWKIFDKGGGTLGNLEIDKIHNSTVCNIFTISATSFNVYISIEMHRKIKNICK